MQYDIVRTPERCQQCPLARVGGVPAVDDNGTSSSKTARKRTAKYPSSIQCTAYFARGFLHAVNLMSAISTNVRMDFGGPVSPLRYQTV